MPEMHPHHVHLLAVAINETARKHGFWDNERNMGEMLMLATSELSEALEEHRQGRPTVWFQHEDSCLHAPLNELHDLQPGRAGCTCHPKPEGAAVELGDAIMRCLDTMFKEVAATPYTIDDVLRMKMEYNDHRSYKAEGKAY